MAVEDIGTVRLYRTKVQELLDKAAELKQSSSINPAITELDLGISGSARENEEDAAKGQDYAAVETAFREKFYHLLATTSINEPEFVHIWNLLDIVSIFSDNEQCEPGLIFWLIEELLDSQTIDGCRKVFDYLESRRERNTAKHFKQKSLIILRSCNELLRRLSRAEDTVFCGRVFIYLFQSFPLGDKSSVNLRGEYHTENVTTFDESPAPAPESQVADVEMKDAGPARISDEPASTQTAVDTQTDSAPAAAETDGQKPTQSTIALGPPEDAPIDMDELYPVFWGLQSSFSHPTRLFDPEQFVSFRKGLEATISSFRKVSIDLEKRGMTKGSEENARRGVKRKRAETGSELSNTFNPKYLTSRDLFELEANDVAFRRHILVQSLIILDFLISLTPKSKTKLADATNKSVLYAYVLNDEDAKWANQMKSMIASYLQQGPDGKFYYRMVDTVLTRDKNWVRWKAEGCPPIEKPAIATQNYLDAQASTSKLTANRRLKQTPLGSLDLKFLSESATSGNLDCLKQTDRFSVPEADSYMLSIADDEFDLERAETSEEKEEASRARASKIWRVLRLASRNKMNQFDNIEDGKKLKLLFEPPPSSEKTASGVENLVAGPKDEQAKTEQLQDITDGTGG